MARACSVCSAELPVQTGRGRRRTKCASCAPSRGKAFLLAEAELATRVDRVTVNERTLVAAVRSELRGAGVLGTSSGQAAMLLAKRLQDGEEDTGSAIAALVKELRVTIVGALANEVSEADPLDDLARRRAERRA